MGPNTWEHRAGTVAEAREPGARGRFAALLRTRGLSLRRARTTSLQVNVGLRCNQSCAHCRLDAGPDRPELMDERTMADVLAWAARAGFAEADVTGGAPELHPALPRFLESLTRVIPLVRLRSNLTALLARWDELAPVLVSRRVTVTASFPSTDAAELEGQRGAGVFAGSIQALRRLNRLGHGLPGSGLGLDLVVNPAGLILPEPERDLEHRFRERLEADYGIRFSRLLAFANLPLGRFDRWLAATGRREEYFTLLERSFNPATLPALMCRTTVALRWDGLLFDCDFNLPLPLPLGGRPMNVREADGLPDEGLPIAVGDHCLACTAGAGFT